MIDISISNTFLSLHGHADYAEYGKDIVCAAVSTLFCTLLAYVQDEGSKTDHEIRIAPQDKSIRMLRVDEDIRDKHEAVWDAVTLGLTIVAEQYSDYITISKGVD